MTRAVGGEQRRHSSSSVVCAPGLQLSSTTRARHAYGRVEPTLRAEATLLEQDEAETTQAVVPKCARQRGCTRGRSVADELPCTTAHDADVDPSARGVPREDIDLTTTTTTSYDNSINTEASITTYRVYRPGSISIDALCVERVCYEYCHCSHHF